jgi:hypothetical protein
MTARALVEVAGDRLIGRRVLTEAIGFYPRRAALVVEMAPDPGVPEIIFTVVHPAPGPAGCAKRGVFEWEEVLLL